MRYLPYLLLFLALSSFGQKNEVFHIDSLPVEGIRLNQGWKWRAGDNADFAKADFDDSKWESINPTKDIMDLPQIWKAEVVWFRLRFIADSSLLNKSLVMQVNQTGASEIFLNGKFIKKFGEIDTKTHQIQASTPNYGSFIGLPIRKKGEQVLSVRFAIQKNIFYIFAQGQRNVALSLRVMEASSISLIIENNIVPYFEFSRFGLFLILSILHFALFCLRKSQKANLYFFLYAFLAVIASLLYSLAYHQVYFAATKMIFIFISYSLLIVGYMFFLTAIYSVFNRKRGFIYWFLFVYEIVGLVVFLMDYRNGYNIAITIPLILNLLESTRISFLANRRNLRGSNIIIIGSISSAVFSALFYLIKIGYLPPGPKWLYVHLSVNIAFICIPISISIYLALESAFASNSLKLKLIEVENLSAEKEQILTTQNETLERQVAERTAALHQSLTDLKATQSQLIQKEKLASLGELTAGIAHEIQNPLNFVNNFSELSVELAKELKEERLKVKEERDEELENELVDDLILNQEKINLHGKRASSIVKGMLEHSRTATGERVATELNQLTEEYLRLAYQGFRAKNKDFTCDLAVNFDLNVGEVDVVPQEIGRVLLNLINNAFYAVNQRATSEIEFNPKVVVSTQTIGNQVVIQVQDNGAGIPDAIKGKIFQPFFTTKPTGEGTGLGLSLAYDIVTKGHGGTLKMETKEGEGTTFIIQLPLV